MKLTGTFADFQNAKRAAEEALKADKRAARIKRKSARIALEEPFTAKDELYRRISLLATHAAWKANTEARRLRFLCWTE